MIVLPPTVSVSEKQRLRVENNCFPMIPLQMEPTDIGKPVFNLKEEFPLAIALTTEYSAS